MDARFRTLGCGAAIASSSMATELLKGRTLEEARHFSNQEVVAALGGLPPAKMQCSLLAAQALRAALEDYEKRHPASGRAPARPLITSPAYAPRLFGPPIRHPGFAGGAGGDEAVFCRGLRQSFFLAPPWLARPRRPRHGALANRRLHQRRIARRNHLYFRRHGIQQPGHQGRRRRPSAGRQPSCHQRRRTPGRDRLGRISGGPGLCLHPRPGGCQRND